MAGAVKPRTTQAEATAMYEQLAGGGAGEAPPKPTAKLSAGARGVKGAAKDPPPGTPDVTDLRPQLRLVSRERDELKKQVAALSQKEAEFQKQSLLSRKAEVERRDLEKENELLKKHNGNSLEATRDVEAVC